MLAGWTCRTDRSPGRRAVPRRARRPPVSTGSPSWPAKRGLPPARCATTRSASCCRRRAGRAGSAGIRSLTWPGCGSLVTCCVAGIPWAGPAELLAAWERGYDLATLLGIEQAMTASWSAEAPEPVTVAGISAQLQDQLTPDVLAEAVQLGYVELDGDRVRVSGRLLETTTILVREGIPLPAILAAGRELQAGLDSMAALLVELVISNIPGGRRRTAGAGRDRPARGHDRAAAPCRADRDRRGVRPRDGPADPGGLPGLHPAAGVII